MSASLHAAAIVAVAAALPWPPEASSDWGADVTFERALKADDTPYPLARVGIKRLRRVNAPIVGVVLNQLDVEKADRYYGEYSGYGKRYYGKYGNKKYGYGYGPTKS